MNFVDTANVYHGGRSEEVVGRALAGRRHQVVLATKFHDKTGDGPNDQGNSRPHILRRLRGLAAAAGTDYIDLYHVHRPAPDVPVEETLAALTDLVRAGKVRYIGCSTHPAWMVMEALAVSERHGFARYVSEQPPYNLLDRRIENELVPAGANATAWRSCRGRRWPRACWRDDTQPTRRRRRIRGQPGCPQHLLASA